jgi:hypothetical protein
VFGVFRDISVMSMVDSMVNRSMVDSMVADMMDTMDKLSLFSVCGGDCSNKGEEDSQDSECLEKI